MKNQKWLHPLVALTVATASVTTATVSHAAGLVKGEVTADNDFALYTGSYTQAKKFWGDGHSWPSAKSFNFSTKDDYLYIATWSDDAVAQGLLHDLTVNGNPVFSGSTGWEVFATGQDKDGGSPNPTLAQLTTQIGIANINGGNASTTSIGWVAPTNGGNNGISPWGTIANINTSAKWTWYYSRSTGQTNPFTSGANHREYLIFRTTIGTVPEPTVTLGIFAVSGLALFTKRLKTQKV